MIHEFVRAIIEDRKPVVDDIVGAYWTGTGICAHQSAMEGGTVVKVPESLIRNRIVINRNWGIPVGDSPLFFCCSYGNSIYICTGEQPYIVQVFQ